MARVLIVDDEAAMRRVLAMILRDDDHALTEASGVADAKRLLKLKEYDLVITDQKMKDGEGLSLIDVCREVDSTLPVVVITAYATVELAVEAMRRGAFDFIAKPFEPESVRAVVRRATQHTELVRENQNLRGAVQHLRVSRKLVGVSEGITRVRELIARVAPTDATVLITGETGTGKELLARAIHERSLRAEKPFVAVNCAALAETLLESELFGHERGAFTGADRTRQGLFEAAHHGTLLLDETAEMTPPLQAKLLRVLVDGEVLRIGATIPRHVDVRILAATHRDLRQRVDEGAFREDLFYRLAVVPLHIPPLRERKQDLPLLVDQLLTQVSRDLKISPRRMSAAALAKLSTYTFPGNVRELRNLLERACILAQGPQLEPEDFLVHPSEGGRQAGSESTVAPPSAFSSSSLMDLRQALERTERELILRALDEAAGVQAEAARRLGLSRSHLAYKLRKHGIDRPGGS